MATKKKESVDDLLDDEPKAKLADEENIDELLDGVPPAEVKTKKASVPKTPAEPRQLKGRMVTFLTKNGGKRVIGMGTDYIVARMHGKLFYKEKSQVQELPEDWKDGDPIPGVEGPLNLVEPPSAKTPDLTDDLA